MYSHTTYTMLDCSLRLMKIFSSAYQKRKTLDVSAHPTQGLITFSYAIVTHDNYLQLNSYFNMMNVPRFSWRNEPEPAYRKGQTHWGIAAPAAPRSCWRIAPVPGFLLHKGRSLSGCHGESIKLSPLPLRLEAQCYLAAPMACQHWRLSSACLPSELRQLQWQD